MHTYTPRSVAAENVLLLARPCSPCEWLWQLDELFRADSLFSHVCWGGKDVTYSTSVLALCIGCAVLRPASNNPHLPQPQQEAEPQMPRTHLLHHFLIIKERVWEKAAGSSSLISHSEGKNRATSRGESWCLKVTMSQSHLCPNVLRGKYKLLTQAGFPLSQNMTLFLPPGSHALLPSYAGWFPLSPDVPFPAFKGVFFSPQCPPGPPLQFLSVLQKAFSHLSCPHIWWFM